MRLLTCLAAIKVLEFGSAVLCCNELLKDFLKGNKWSCIGRIVRK